MLLAVPNLSEGTGALAPAFGPGVLDVHADPHHNRTVVSMRMDMDALLAGIRETIARVDLTKHEGVHPRVGAVDVAPVVYTRAAERGEAVALALVLADEIGRLGVPVHLYGMFGRKRAEVRKDPGEPDFGPREAHPTAGRTLVTARPPLIAFNAYVDTTLEHAKEIAALVRRLPGVVALGVPVGDRVQVTANLEGETTREQFVAAVAEHAPGRRDGARRARPALHRLRGMAQTKRKRRTKHRGNAAGMVESRGPHEQAGRGRAASKAAHAPRKSSTPGSSRPRGRRRASRRCSASASCSRSSRCSTISPPARR